MSVYTSHSPRTRILRGSVCFGRQKHIVYTTIAGCLGQHYMQILTHTRYDIKYIIVSMAFR